MPSVFDVTNREHTKFSEETGAKNVIIYDSSGNAISLYTRGSKKVIPIEVVDASGNQITQFGVDDNYPAGSGSNGSVTLTSANTAYAVPASAPTEKYVLILYNDSGSDIYFGYENSNSNGMLMEDGDKVAFDLGANQQIYCYSATAGVSIKYSYKEVA